jgi:hypothetical protein
MIPAADAAPDARVASAQHAKAVAPVTVVKRLSAAKGVAGNRVLVQGVKLATYEDDADPGTDGDQPGWVAKTVKFVAGETSTTASTVSALSETALVVTVPAGSNGATIVTVGDAVKGPKFTYAAPITVTTLQTALTALAPVSETGLADVTIAGTNFTKSTKVVVGGKTAKIAKDGVAANGTSLGAAFPAGLWGVQDVVVVDGGVSYFVGYVTYAGNKPTVTAATGTAYNEVASTVVLTGTNLNLITGATYEGVKTAFKVTKADATTLSVTIPKGADAVVDGELKVTTKYGESATFEVDRSAAPVPAVTAVAGAVAAGGEVTLTGTNLTGLKKVVVKSAAGKLVTGKVVSVTSATSAKVKLPALAAAADYKIQVFAISLTGSTEYTFAVAAS